VKTLIEPENLLVQLARLNKSSHQFQDLRKTYKKPPLQDLRKTYKKPPLQDLRKTYKKPPLQDLRKNLRENFLFRIFGKLKFLFSGSSKNDPQKTPFSGAPEKRCL